MLESPATVNGTTNKPSSGIDREVVARKERARSKPSGPSSWWVRGITDRKLLWATKIVETLQKMALFDVYLILFQLNLTLILWNPLWSAQSWKLKKKINIVLGEHKRGRCFHDARKSNFAQGQVSQSSVKSCYSNNFLRKRDPHV